MRHVKFASALFHPCTTIDGYLIKPCHAGTRHRRLMNVTIATLQSRSDPLGGQEMRRDNNESQSQTLRGDSVRVHGLLVSTTASASISSSQSGSMKRTTCIIVFAGRMLPKNSPWTVATRSQSSMRIRRIRVRTTSKSLPQSPSMADWMISKHLRA